MNVWVDPQDLCTGDGLCAEILPSVFTLLGDGLSYVRDGDRVMAPSEGNEGGYEGRVWITLRFDGSGARSGRGVPRGVHLRR